MKIIQRKNNQSIRLLKNYLYIIITIHKYSKKKKIVMNLMGFRMYILHIEVIKN